MDRMGLYSYMARGLSSRGSLVGSGKYIRIPAGPSSLVQNDLLPMLPELPCVNGPRGIFPPVFSLWDKLWSCRGVTVKHVRWVMLLVFVVVACVGCDQATKTAAKALLPQSGALTMLDNTITLVYTENAGAFLSLGASWPEEVRFALFTVASGLVLVVACTWLLRAPRGSHCQQLGLALLVAGGVGNLIDRLTHHGRVVDFIHLAVGPIHTGIFNVADVAITGGVLLLVVHVLWGRPAPHS